MPKIALWLGALLLLLGLVGWLGTGRESLTALIPAVFGVLFALVGWLGRAESRRKHAMHAAALLALLGVVGSFDGLGGALRLMGGGELERPEAALAKAVMALLCLSFLALAIRSFVMARRAREAEA